MLIHLPPGFEPAAHARNILEAIFNEVSSGAETAVTVIAVHDHRCLFVDVLDEFLNVTVMKVPRAGYMGRAIGTRIANIDEDALFLVEFFLGLVYLYLWYVVHYLAPCLCSIHHRLILQATVVHPATAPFTGAIHITVYASGITPRHEAFAYHILRPGRHFPDFGIIRSSDVGPVLHEDAWLFHCRSRNPSGR